MSELFSKKIKLYTHRILWIVLIIGYLNSPFLERFRLFYYIHLLFKIINMFYVIKNIKKIRFNIILCLIILSEFCLCISTYRSNTGFQTAIIIFINVVFPAPL